jgi:thiamine kinase-like enzyme
MLANSDDRLDLSILNGIGLHEAGRSMDLATWRVAWDTLAAAWPGIASAHRGTTQSLPPHTAHDELAGLRTWLDHVRAFAALPRLQRQLTGRYARLANDLTTTKADPPVVSHRDLHDKQLLWDGQTIGLLDLDTLARAEAACDLANLGVHAELRTLQGLWTVDHRDIVLDRIAQLAHTVGASPRRVAAYAEATRLRLTMLYAFRPRWAPLMGDWLNQQTLTAAAST